MKDQFRIIIVGENQIRLLSRILIIFNRKNIKINYINFSNYENGTIDNFFKYIIDLECLEEQLMNLTKLIEKLIGIINVYFFKKNKKYRENSCKKINFPLATF